MINLYTNEEQDHQDVNENTCLEFPMTSRYGSFHEVVQEQCNDDHVAHFQVSHQEKSELNYSKSIDQDTSRPCYYILRSLGLWLKSKLNYSNSIDQDISRPCYYILRLLGLWVPANASCFCKFYHYFVVPIVWVGTIVANIMLCFKDSKFHWRMFLNSLTTSATLVFPFWFCWVHLRDGKYDQLVLYLTNYKKATSDKVRSYSKRYTWISIALWILGGAFFYAHWIPLFPESNRSLFYYFFYAFVVFLSTGWWACWFGLYGFVCHLHKLQINRYCQELNYMFGYSKRSMDIETFTAAILLDKFHDIRRWLDQTNKIFRIIISISIISHFVDLLIFTVAYWTNDFGGNYGTWHYIGGIAFDILSILGYLCPAAMVGQALHNIVFYAGEHCHPNPYLFKLPKEKLSADLFHLPKQRFAFYRYVFLREENLGLHVLGVKITSGLTVGFVMTLITSGLTFLKYAIPFIENLKL